MGLLILSSENEEAILEPFDSQYVPFIFCTCEKIQSADPVNKC